MGYSDGSSLGKFPNHKINRALSDPLKGPDGCAKSTHPEEPALVIDGKNFFRGKMYIGGKCVPEAETKATMVVLTPR